MSPAERDAQIAELIARRRSAADGDIPRIDSSEPAPLSAVQLSLWLMDALGGTSDGTARPTAARLVGALDHEALRVALEALLERHEPLRTVYPLVGEEPVQQLVPNPRVQLRTTDLSALNPDERELAIRQAMLGAVRVDAGRDDGIAFSATLLVETATSHVLVVGLSHIAFDGWSEVVFRADLLELYRAEVQHVAPQLPELKIRFSDYARWERAQRQPEQVEADLDYWCGALAGLGQAPPLPRQADAGGDIGMVTASLDGVEMAAIRGLAREQNTTPFVVLLSALQLLVRDLSDADDFVLSCPVAGRDRPEVFDLVSCFINPLLVRSAFRGATTRLDLLKGTRAAVAGALGHRGAPHRDVVAQFGSWASRPELTRVSFQWRDFPQRRANDSTPLVLEPLTVPVSRQGLDLTVTPTADGADLKVEFNPALFGPETVSTWCTRLRDHVRELCADPAGALGPLRPIVSAPDPSLDLTPQPIERVAAAVKRQRDHNPDAVAVEGPAGTLSYAELWDRSGALAAKLLELGTAPGDHVGLLTNRNAGHVTAMLAILRAGGVAVPIDATLPSGRIQLMQATAPTSVTVIVDRCVTVGEADAARTVHVDIEGALVGSKPPPMERVDVAPSDDSAYVFFTSGTSGTPKAVLGTHLGLSHFINWERSRIGIVPTDRVAGVTGPSFDVSMRELFLPLTCGACLVTAPETLQPDHGLSWLASSAVTVAHVTPSLASAWISDDTSETNDLPLRWTLFAGEPLLDSLVERWSSISAVDARIMNLYGPTETCLVKAGYEVDQNPRSGVQPVGWPLPFTQLLVVAHGEPRLCEPGEPGEVYIRTSVGTSGYLGDDLGGFVQNPLTPDVSDLVYRTGDVGWYEADCSVTVQGRVDDQLKIDGVRIEPAEVESFLSKHPGIRQCIVLPVDHDGTRRIEAFVVAKGEAPRASELRRYLSEWLRPSAIPPVFHSVDKIPLTSNNKVDRRALLKTSVVSGPATSTLNSGDGKVAAAVELAWQDVLGVDTLSADTDFFVAGGTSLRALRILARIAADLGDSPKIDIFFDSPTLAEFTMAIESHLGMPRTSAVVALPEDQQAAGAPLSFMQEAMWAQSALDPSLQLYELNRVFGLHGQLDAGALRSAVGGLAERHEVLRTLISVDRGEPIAHVGDAGLVHLEQVDLSSAPVDERLRLVNEQLQTCQEQHFDLVNGPLIRFVLFRVSEDHHQLLIRGHHMILDGWSLRILAEDLGHLYDAEVRGVSADLPTLKLRYVDYVKRQRDRDKSGAYEQGLTHWTEVLSEPLPEFTLGGPRRSAELVAPGLHRFEVDSDFSGSLDVTARALRVTPFTLGLSLWSAFLCAKSGDAELVVGVPVADRSWAPTNSMVGLFLNTVPIRVLGGAGQSLADLTRETHHRVLAAFRYAEVPFERVLEVAAPERRRTRTPLYRVMFQYHHNESSLNDGLLLDGLSVERLQGKSAGPAVDLYLSVDHGDGTRGRLRYDPRLVSSAEAAELATEFLVFARAALAQPELTLPELDRFELSGPVAEPHSVPLSYAQERMWFVEQLEPGTVDYVLPVVRRVKGPVNVDALERALTRVVSRHGVLRTRIVTSEGKPLAFVDQPRTIPIVAHDLRTAAFEGPEVAANKLIADLSETPFDLSEGNLVRAMAVRLDDERWLLAFAFHHIVMDAGSFRVFFGDLGAFYDAELSGTAAPIPELGTQYWDFAQYQRDQADSGAFEESLAFWEQALVLPLPLSTLGSPSQNGEHHVAVTATAPLPDGFVDQFQSRAAELHVTPYMLCLAVWTAVLCDETGQDEVLTAMVATDRSWAETAPLVGYFVNTLPLRMGAARGASLNEVVRSVRAAALGAYSNAAVPLDLILDRVRMLAAAAGSLVNGIEISLYERGTGEPDLSLTGTSIAPHRWQIGSMKFDLQLGLDLDPVAPSAMAKGRASVVSKADMDRLVARFVAVASACLDDPTQPMRLTAPKSPEPVSLVPHRFDELVRAEPGHIVIEHGHRHVTAAQFDALSSGIAASLVDLNVKPGDMVVLAAKRSPLAIAAMYACWKVGAAYVPVDVEQPLTRTQAIVNDCGPAAVLSDGSISGLRGVAVVELDADRVGPGAHLRVAVEADTAAYVIYTSGSTGHPKGVVVSHGALAAFAHGAIPAYDLKADDRVLQFHSLAFDASVEEIHVSLARGATLIVPDLDLLGSARRFLQFVGEQRISVVSMPTVYWHELVRQCVDAVLQIPPCLETLIIGGEAARHEVVSAWHTLRSSTQLINSYGPTEATVVVFATPLLPGAAPGYVSIGHPLPQVEAAILDPDGSPLPSGEWGELVVGGPQLATGYLGLDAETAARFVGGPGARRRYKTGDRARRLPNGEVEVSGRFDDQVKIAGHRIEPGEVERVLRANRAVTEVCVVPARNAGQDLSLVAFVVVEDGYPSDAVVEAAGQDLPKWMVPTRFSFVEQLPTTPGGKIDRASLRASADTVEQAETMDVAPAASETIARLSALWCELLDVPEAGPDVNFFELGGRSLTAVRLSYLIESEFDVSLLVADILETPTIAELSVRIDAERGIATAPRSRPDEGESRAEAGAPSESAWPRSPVRLHLDRAPLSFSQQRIWLHQELRDDRSGYMIRSSCRLRGALDAQVLAQAVAHVVASNEVLRTRIVQGPEGRPAQHVDPVDTNGMNPALTQHDLRGLDPSRRRERAAELQREFVRPGFDLATDHPLRLLLIAVGPLEHLLTVVVHHIAVDGDGLALLLGQVGSAYATLLAGGALPESPPLQFADFAVWQRARLSEGAEDQAFEYWRDRLAGVDDALELPGRRSRPQQHGLVEDMRVDFSESVATELAALADRSGASSFQLLLALLNVLFHRLTGSDDIVLGTPSTERRSVELHGMVGLFVNTLVLRSKVEPANSFADVLKAARTRVGEALDNSGVPFDALIDELRVRRDPDRLPLVSVLCASTEDEQGPALSLPGVDVEPMDVPPGGAGAVAELLVHSRRDPDGRFGVGFRYDTSVLEPWVVRQIAKALEVLAAAVVADPGAAVGELPIIEPAEEAWLATGLNQNARPYPESERLDVTFAEVASRHPDRVAVVDARRQLTYDELRQEVAEFAETLGGLGSGLGVAVGLRLDRSVELAVAMLAVLKTGAVYVPIDAHAPEARCQETLDQAGVAVVVTASEDGGLHAEETGRSGVELPHNEDDVPAYVMFTSGSTGQPKGVVISHRAIQRTVHNVDYTSLGPDAVVAMASNPAFDALTFEVWGALLTGARLEIVDTDTLTRPVEFGAWLRESGVSTMFLTTSLANLTVAGAPDAFCTLDTLIVGGEAVDVATMASLVERGPRRLVNGYGPTECTTFSVWYHVTSVDPEATSVPIGGPTANTDLYVLDQTGALVPQGLDGELCIAGPGLAMGYLGDPELTSERFVNVKIAGETVRVYRTGDLVRRNAKGVISYVGRRDHQIKLRGFRIELGEIEAALSRDPGVTRAAVRLFGEGSKRRLVGYVVGAGVGPVDLIGLREALGALVPAYMVPSQLVELDAIPLTKSAKVDRRALIEPAPEEAASVDEAIDELDQAVLDAWRDALQLSSLGLDADFFESGGNSLLGVEMLAVVEREFLVELRLSTLFDARTPRQLAALIRAKTASSKGAPLDHVVTLRGGQPDSRPLWLIHPAGGSLVLYEPMVSNLSSHRRVLGVEASGLDGTSVPLASVEDLADHQLEAVLRAQPHGPYRIVGYSIGGVVGLELARRLVERGEKVELLGAIEAGVPAGPRALGTRRERYAPLLRRGNLLGVLRLLKGSLDERRKLNDERRRIARNQLDRAHKAVLDNMVHAFEHFEPTPLNIDMTLFFGNETAEETAQQLRTQWSSLATGDVSIRRVSGSHDDDSVLRDPHAPVLAAAIEEELDACDRGGWT